MALSPEQLALLTAINVDPSDAAAIIAAIYELETNRDARVPPDNFSDNPVAPTLTALHAARDLLIVA